MAVLSKIRDKSLFLILIIGMALFAFVASPKDIGNFFKSDKTNYVGSVNGEEISREEFASQIKTYKDQRSNANDTQATSAVWNSITSQKIYSSQLKEAGIVVGEKDIWDAMVNDNSIKTSPQFQNEAGLFDEESLKAYIADLQEDTSESGKTRWASWIAYENGIKQNLEQTAYLSLVKSGLGVSIEEGKRDYLLQNKTISGNYVFLPFTSIPDSTISVSDSDIQSYINNHKNDYQVKATRDIQYVKFDLLASEEDKEAIKIDLQRLIEDDNQGLGLKNTKDYSSFIADNSDIPFNDNYVFKNKLSPELGNALFELETGAIYGPYEENGYYKLSKIIESKEVPEVKASHILIAYKDALRAKPEVVRTKEEAKTEANKILRKVKGTSVDFATEAKISSDGPSSTKGGDLGWFKEGQMVPAFNDWVFSHKKNDIGIVETDFGFHIIKLNDTKVEKGLKLATISKIIAPSEKTENLVFVEAETFAANIAKGGSFKELANEKKYSIKNAQKLGRRETSVPGLKGNNANIVYWAFEDNTEIGSSKRFDIDKAYVVGQLTQKEPEGLQSVKSASLKVKPLVIKDKKAKALAAKLKGTLNDIVTNENVRLQKTGEISLANPSVIGREKAILGAFLAMKEGTTIHGVRGTKGVYSLELIKKTDAVTLDSYEPYRIQLEQKMKKDNNTIYNALKEASDIEDYRN
ncbi:MAG TPA: peptidylprolyl isomerase [Lutibacter sp.]|nr:peptidylprolyl isomerase [Lutibacter sp.]